MNYKRLLKLTTIFVGIVIFLFSSQPTQAIKSIPDGGARIPSSGKFMPEQKNVDAQVKKLWEKNN